MTNFKINKLDAGDGNPFTGKNDNDKLSEKNLLEVGVSKELAAGLDGKTIGQFKSIVTNAIAGKGDINPELLSFSKQIFASYNNTGYEDKNVNAAITKLENQVCDSYPRQTRGLVYDYSTSSAVTPKDQTPAPLPASLQIAQAAQTPDKSMYGVAGSPSIREMNKLGI